MRKTVKLPRILKIEAIRGFEVYCVFNNGETRVIDFAAVFREWKISKSDPEFVLLKEEEFRKVRLRNQTLSWKNAGTEANNLQGKKVLYPFELSPDLLYAHSRPVVKRSKRFSFGTLIRESRLKKGLSQQELAMRSGTSKAYISRVENELIEPELSTLYKIVELGLGRKLRVDIV